MTNLNHKITDHYHQLIILLTSQIQNTGDIYLQTFINNQTIPYKSYVAETNSQPLKFTIKYTDYTIGDTITKIQMVLTNNNGIPLYALNEGITILVDGVETDVKLVTDNTIQTDTDGNPIKSNTVTTNQFACNFPDADLHTIQAIYKGNEEIGIGYSNKITLKTEQKQSDDETNGDYVLEIVKMPKTMKYMSEVDWQFKLTKGGQAIGGKTIEKITPRNIWSDTDYNKDGIYYVKTPSVDKLKLWNVGEHNCGARFYHYDDPNSNKSILCSAFQKITITKNTPRLTCTSPASGKKGKVKFYLRYPKITGITDTELGINNAKITIKVGGKTYTKTTNENGLVSINKNTTKTVKYKVTYAGNKNLNSITKTFT